MTRMIERWFPCAEVSESSQSGWGSGNTESSLWVWFAKRPVSQSKAAILTSLLPWPDDHDEQERLKKLVRSALSGYGAAQKEVLDVLAREYPDTARVLDPFSGRAMIPLEAGRLQAKAYGTDCSPFVTLGGQLLADLIHRDWDNEPETPFPAKGQGELGTRRMAQDAGAFMGEVGRRFSASMAPYYPTYEGKQPWGYLWASTLPCQECGLRFPLVGELTLRQARPKVNDLGQSFRLRADKRTGKVMAEVHDGPPDGRPTRVQAGKSKYAAEGRVAVCPFCDHVHVKELHTRLSMEGLRRDQLLVAADIDAGNTKMFRSPTAAEEAAAEAAAQQLRSEEPFGFLAALPDEPIGSGNTRTIQSVNYGDKTYGDLFEPRQALGLIHLARAINECTTECIAAGTSPDYARALAAAATAAMMRKIRRSTRGARLQITGGSRVGDLFVNQSAVSFSYDWFESGLSDGPGSWSSLAGQTVTAIRNITDRAPARPANIDLGDATLLPFRDATFDAVVTDPPYDDMIDYSDSTDVFYVWAKRAMSTADVALSLAARPDGLQDKSAEIIVKRGGGPAGDPRTKDRYDTLIGRAFAEARRVVSADGVVTIVFGHGDPEVWHRLLSAVDTAELVLTGAWPAKTESAANTGSANIVTTLTMACRPAAPDRPTASRAAVERELRAEVQSRLPMWEEAGLAVTDMLMASAGPAMEVAGRYSLILNAKGEPVPPFAFLPLARRAVQEALSGSIDHQPLETFDARSRFALWWVRVYGRQVQAKSELRWQALAASMDLTELRDLVPDSTKGCRFVEASRFNTKVTAESPVIDVALAMAKAWPAGLDAVGEVLDAAGRDPDDAYLWGAMSFLADKLPDSDADGIAWTSILRNRRNVASAAHGVNVSRSQAQIDAMRRENQPTLLGDANLWGGGLLSATLTAEPGQPDEGDHR